MDLLILITSLIIINLVLLFNLESLGKFINIYDRPDGKLKKHTIETPLLGGVIFFINFYFLYYLNYYF